MRPTSVLWARALFKDDSIAKAHKVSNLNKQHWKTFYNVVKTATQAHVGKRMRFTDVAEQNQIIQDLAPVLAAKNIPPVDEPIWQWAIQRAERTCLEVERSMVKKAQAKWYSHITKPPIDPMAPWNRLLGNLTSIMETFPTTNWDDLTTDQKHALKVQLANRCDEQGLPAPNMELCKLLLNRLHNGVLNTWSRTAFISKMPTQSDETGPTEWKPVLNYMGHGSSSRRNVIEAVKTRANTPIDGRKGGTLGYQTARETGQPWDEKSIMKMKTSDSLPSDKSAPVDKGLSRKQAGPLVIRKHTVHPHAGTAWEGQALPFIRKIV